MKRRGRYSGLFILGWNLRGPLLAMICKWKRLDLEVCQESPDLYVDVRVNESRGERLAAQVHHPGSGTYHGADFVVATDSQDQAIFDRDGLSDRVLRVNGEDAGVEQRQVRNVLWYWRRYGAGHYGRCGGGCG